MFSWTTGGKAWMAIYILPKLRPVGVLSREQAIFSVPLQVLPLNVDDDVDDDYHDDDDLPDIQGVPLSCSGFIRRTNSRNRKMALIFPCWYSQWGGSS